MRLALKTFGIGKSVVTLNQVTGGKKQASSCRDAGNDDREACGEFAKFVTERP